MPVCFVQFRAKYYVLNPKLGDYEDISISSKNENRHRYKENN
jgi:hypothetical protein